MVELDVRTDEVARYPRRDSRHELPVKRDRVGRDEPRQARDGGAVRLLVDEVPAALVRQARLDLGVRLRAQPRQPLLRSRLRVNACGTAAQLEGSRDERA